MLDSIYVAASGLNGHQKGLKNISNNVANMNSPGYKGSNNQFTDVYLRESGQSGTGQDLMPGGGLQLLKPSINFESGEVRATGRDMDTAIQGAGFFVVRDGQGNLLYTKAGRFEFDANGNMVTMEDGHEVMGHASSNESSLVPVTLGALRLNPMEVTSEVRFVGNLSSTDGDVSDSGPDLKTDPVTVYDGQGTARALTFEFTVKRVKDAATQQVTLESGAWDVKAKEGDLEVGAGQYKMLGNGADPQAKAFSIALTSKNGALSNVLVSLGGAVTALSTGTTSTIKAEFVDGHAPGTLTATSLDASGAVVITYSNGQTAKGPKIAVAEFSTPELLTRATGALFSYEGTEPVQYVSLGDATVLRSGSLELSNVDLTDQFSTMILIQRGFQASSQVLSTANEMIQSLYDLKSRR
jgi:flagellar hook protein FlgE